MKIDKKNVVDVNHRLIINVTKTDCRRGSSKNAKACAAALAIQREYGAKEVRVHISRTYVRRSGNKWERYITPASLRSEIIAFDRGGEFQPGTYLLSPVQPTQRLDYLKATQPSRKKKKNGGRHRMAKRIQHKVAGVREKMEADWV